MKICVVYAKEYDDGYLSDVRLLGICSSKRLAAMRIRKWCDIYELHLDDKVDGRNCTDHVFHYESSHDESFIGVFEIEVDDFEDKGTF